MNTWINPQTRQRVYSFFGRHVQTTGPPNRPLYFDEGFEEYMWKHVGPQYDNQAYVFGQRPSLNLFSRQLRTRVGLELGQNIAQPGNLFDNSVWHVRDITDTRHHYVLKVCNLKYYTRMDDNDRPIEFLRTAVTKLLKEVRTLLYIRHPNIIEVLDYFSLEDFSVNFPFNYHCTLMPAMEGSLDRLQQGLPGNRMTETQAYIWFRQIVSAVNFLHNQMGETIICHLAIRPANVLHHVPDHFPKDDNHRVYKLTDFEETAAFTRGDEQGDCLLVTQLPRSFNNWSPPELRVAGRHAMPMDIYSLGCSLMTNLLGLPQEFFGNANGWFNPFMQYIWSYHLDEHFQPTAFDLVDFDHLTHIQQTVYGSVSPATCRLIGQCMANANLRPTIEQVIQMIDQN